MKIYVAGPYSPQTTDLHDAARLAQQNTSAAIRTGIELIKLGHLPFIPHLTHYVHLECREPLPYEFYCEYDMAWLRCCDALFFLGHSRGADAELQWAKDHRLPVFYSLAEVPPNGKQGDMLPLRKWEVLSGEEGEAYVIARDLTQEQALAMVDNLAKRGVHYYQRARMMHDEV